MYVLLIWLLYNLLICRMQTHSHAQKASHAPTLIIVLCLVKVCIYMCIYTSELQIWQRGSYVLMPRYLYVCLCVHVFVRAVWLARRDELKVLNDSSTNRNQ